MASKLQKSNTISVIGSFAVDHITDLAGAVHKRHGGPAHWIRQTLKELRVPFLVISGRRPALVDIHLDTNGEQGDFRRVDPIRLRTPRTAKAFIISTIENEFPIEKLHLLHGVIAVDLQGYVRNARVSGTLLHIPSSLARRIAIAKVTASEFAYLEQALIASQKKRILIVTHGGAGFEIFYKGRRNNFTNRRILSSDTIGAGDTFLAAFVVEWLRTKNISKAALTAQGIVRRFLERKAHTI